MTMTNDLTRHDWEALKALARGLLAAEAAGSPLAGRLVAAGMAEPSVEGPLRLTEPGRKAVLMGSPALWSLCA